MMGMASETIIIPHKAGLDYWYQERMKPAAKRMLKGALAKVEKLQTVQSSGSTVGVGSVDSGQSSSCSFSTIPSRPSQQSAYEEHCKIFGFKPVKSVKKRKGRGLGFLASQKRPKLTYWTKETICLRYTDQGKAPDTEEKMKLAQMGLGFKELKFDTEGDAFHIHSTLLSAYPEIEDCGGYTLMRLGCGSNELVTIESPKDGLNVRYLRDILKSAKLFVRPLQRDIEIEVKKEDGDPDLVCNYPS